MHGSPTVDVYVYIYAYDAVTRTDPCTASVCRSSDSLGRSAYSLIRSTASVCRSSDSLGGPGGGPGPAAQPAGRPGIYTKRISFSASIDRYPFCPVYTGSLISIQETAEKLCATRLGGCPGLPPPPPPPPPQETDIRPWIGVYRLVACVYRA